MPGGLLQLVAYGAQDVYLTGNPQITFFKVVYRRHTNFALETIRNNFVAKPNFGGLTSVTIERSADLISKTYIRVVLSAGTAPAGAQWAWVENIGHALLKTIELQIGGQRIDYHNSDTLQIFRELTLHAEQERGYNILVGNVAAMTTLNNTHDSYTLYIPLKFFFDRNVGVALPLIALQYHEVKINFLLESIENLIVTTGFSSDPVSAHNLSITEATFECGMIYLDTDERRRFVQLSHELLIEQVQWCGPETVSATRNNQILTFNHPVKEVMWVIHSGRMRNSGGSYKYLWYDPNDLDNMLLIATKRFVLACAQYDGNGNIVLVGNQILPPTLPSNTYDTNSILPNPSLPANLLAIFNSLQASAITNTPSMYNVAILGTMLTLAQASTPVASLLSGLPSRSAGGDGAAFNDVTVKMPFNYGVYLDGTVNPLDNAKILMNGQDRFREQDATYFNYLQPYEHHTRTPADGINVYSFAISPEEHQPSGSLNFSRIDMAVLQLYVQDKYETILGNDSLLTSYAVSYNVLRIMSGMGGLAYNV